MNSVELKKEILNDWMSSFTQLSSYSSTILCMTYDIVVVSLHLLKLPYGLGYRPMFEIYPLWEKNEKMIFKYPSLYYPIVDKRGSVFNIKYSLHKYYLPQVIECVQEQVGEFLNTNIYANELIKFIDYQNDSNSFLNANDSFHMPLLELELFLAKYTENIMMINSIKRNIEKQSKKWDPNHFDSSINEIIKMLFDKLEYWDDLMNCVNNNLSIRKISNINKGILI